MEKSKDLTVLFFDNHLVVVEKPRGLVTQPTKEHTESLEAMTKAWVKKEFNKPNDVFLHVVHRIDQVVSGIVLFAKTSKALERLNLFLKEKKFVKKYIAEVEGVISQERGTLIHFLRHDEHKAAVFKEKKADTQEAVLHFQVIERKSKSTIVLIDLETGRYHQIRAQFSAINHPIVGDVKYGAKKIQDAGIYLHHAYLSFPHPVTKEIIQIVSQPNFFHQPVRNLF